MKNQQTNAKTRTHEQVPLCENTILPASFSPQLPVSCPVSTCSSLTLSLLFVRSLVPLHPSCNMAHDRVIPIDFSADSTDSGWQFHRLRRNLPIIATICCTLILGTGALLFKFTDAVPVFYRFTDCKDVLPYHETSPAVVWVDIEDEFFAASVVGLASLLVRKILDDLRVLILCHR